MSWHAAKDAVRGLWNQRWTRRVAYLIVAGVTVTTAVPWLLTRPTTILWALGHVNALVQDETGLSLAIGRVELHPALGSLALHDVHLGGDLLKVDRIEIQADVWGLFGSIHHIRAIRLEHPQLRLTEAGLASLRLKQHPPRQGPLPRFRLDLLSLTRADIEVPEAFGGIPALRYQFDAKGTGLAPNQMRVDLTGAQLALKGPSGWEKGRLDLRGEVSEAAAVVHEAYLRLGESQARLTGQIELKAPWAGSQVEAHLTGVFDISQGAAWAGLAYPPLGGRVDVVAALQGSLQQPIWTLAAEGQELRPSQAAFLPGSLELKGSGGLDHARVDRLRWSSPQGDLEAQANWPRQSPLQATLVGTNLDFDVLGRSLRLPEFQSTRGKFQAQLTGPPLGGGRPHLDQWRGSLKLTLAQQGADAGELVASLDRSRATLDHLKLDLQALKLESKGWARLDARGLAQAEGEGSVQVGAEQVAHALSAWKTVDLDMEGQTLARARVRWNRQTGLELDGSTQMTLPRWHGARADSLQAQVEIRGSDLWVKGIELRKDAGRASGDLWLTWADTAPGQSQLDMCYTAFRLPVAESLRAADLKGEDGKDLPLAGLGSGWVRLRGPYAHLVMNGVAQVESGEAYGIKIPAASSDFWMDLNALRLKLSELRIGERPELLGQGDLPPEGPLALLGTADMDFKAWSWWVDAKGRVDSLLLALPGPRIQAQVEAHLLGPITSPFGDLDLPQGRLAFSRGRIFFGDRSVDRLQGQVTLEPGLLQSRLGLEDMAVPLLALKIRQHGPDLAGDLNLTISPESAQTGLLARSLTEDLLEDLSLTATAKGRWQNGRDLSWTGSLDRLAARFSAFELHQAQPSALSGNALGAQVDIVLEGGPRDPAPPSQNQAARIELVGTVPFSSAAPFTINAKGSADLANLKAILDRLMEVDEYSVLSELHVQGTSRFNFRAHGSFAEPQLDGTLSLSKGQANLRGYQGMEDLQAEFVFKDRTVTIPEENPLRGTLAHGELRAAGALNWRLGGLESYAFKSSLTDFQLRDVPDGLDLQGTLQATLEGTEEEGLLKGKLRADRLGYQAEVKLSDLILRSALSDSGGLVGLDLDDPLERIRLDLDLDLRAPWSFDTNLLKLEGRTEGPFQVLGTLAHPLPRGTLLFQPGGRVTNIFPAGDMVVDRGSLVFSESRPLDPAISLQGSLSSIPGYTVNLDIRGTLSNLTIVPSSTPSLRQDEIVAILINPGNVASVGTSAASSGSTQGAISSGLGSAGVGLISTLAFGPVQDQLRRILGVDRVNVAVRTTSLGTSETEFTLGKSFDLFGQRSAIVSSHRKSGELSIDSVQGEWRFGNLILQLGFTKGGGVGVTPSGEIRHTWSPK